MKTQMRLFTLFLLSVLSAAAASVELKQKLHLLGPDNQVESGGTVTIMSGGHLTIASGGEFTFTGATIAGVLPIANGGTAATSASAARTSLGLAIGTNVQAYDADLTTYAGITPSANIQTLLGAADFAAARTSLGLVIGTNVQAYDADLTTYAGITPSANIQTLLGAADFAAARTSLGLVIGTNVQAYDADLTTYAGITPSANVQTLLGAADYAAFRTSLSVTTNPMTTSQDIIVGGASGVPARLAKGSNGQVLKVVAGSLTWDTDNAGSGASAATSTLTGTQNDFDFSGATTLFMNNATATTLTGFLAGVDGQELNIVSKGAGQVDLSNQAAGSSAVNRVINPVTGTISLAPGSGAVRLVYDATTARWRVNYHRQGALVSVAHSGGNFTGSGSITWTVDAGDQTRFAYVLNGRVLTVYLVLDGTTVSGSGAALQIAIPGGLSANSSLYQGMAIADNNAYATGLCQVVSGTTMYVYRDIAGTNWSAATNTTYVRGSISFDVQ